MSPDHQQKGPGTIRRQLLSLSSVFRPQASKRASLTVAVQEQPTCQERIHYPIFNPLDPRHNPELANSSWRAQERNSSSELRSPMTWVQSISRRSLRRARSGLSALRSGFTHRSSDEEKPEEILVSPVALRRERQFYGVSSGAYTSETQEDLTFGAELSRMDPPTASTSTNTDVSSLVRVPSINSIHSSTHNSPAALPASASASKVSDISGRAVTNSTVNLIYPLANDRDLDFQFDGAGELGANTNSEENFTHAITPTENHLMEQTWGIAISANEEIQMSACGPADHPPSLEERQATNPQQKNISHTTSDAQFSDDQTDSNPISRQSSAEVRFAFPGIYQEALDQWARQNADPSPSQHIPDLSEYSLNLSEYSPNTSQDISSPNHPSPIPSQHSPSPGQHSSSPSQHSSGPSQHSPRIYEQEETPFASQEPLECIVHQDEYSNMPPYHDYDSDEGLIPLVSPQTPITHSEERQPSPYPNPLNCISNRNFAQRWSSISERATAQWSSVGDHSSLYTPDDTTSRDITSTEMTSIESMSNDTWSPIDSEILFPSPVEDGNGYFLFDGKTNNQYPDRGDEPVKSVHNGTGNCGDIRGSQDLTEAISPGIMSLQLIPNDIPGARFEFVEEDTDDEFYPGIVQPRQAW